MANIRQVRKRLRAVRNIRTITKTLETISASRLHRVHVLQVGARPAAAAIEKVLASVVAAAGADCHPLLRPGGGNVHGLVLVTSDRGMCGGYNSRAVLAAINEAVRLSQEGDKVRFFLIGKRGVTLLRNRLNKTADGQRLGDRKLAPPHETAGAFDDRRLYEQVRELADKLLAGFLKGDLASVHLVRMQLVSQAQVQAGVVQILPVAVPGEGQRPAEHDFYPDLPQTLDALLPAAVRIRMLQCFIEAGVSEHTARLTAMSAATSNADDMIRKLTQEMNRVRQARITSELAEIVGGADAVEGSQ